MTVLCFELFVDVFILEKKKKKKFYQKMSFFLGNFHVHALSPWEGITCFLVLTKPLTR
jgi:hypothetical protein